MPTTRSTSPDRCRSTFFEQFTEPFGIGTVLEVDTTEPVDVGALAARVRDALPSTSG